MSAVSRFSPSHRPPEHIDTPVICCAFRAGKLLVQRAGGAPHLPRLDPAQWTATPGERHYVGTLDGAHCFAVELPHDAPLSPAAELLGMRAFILEAEDIFSTVAGYALQIVEWGRTHRYCGSCGKPTVAHAADRARDCPECG